MPEQIALKDIVMLPEIQIRLKISSKVIDEYAAAMKEGVKFSAIDLFRDGDDRLILADGAHRFLAAQQRSIKSIEGEIHECEPEEALTKALEMSLERNCQHGLRLTPADKRNAVERALADKTLRRRSDRALATLCGVSPGLVAEVRKGEEKDVEVKKHKRKPPSPPSVDEEVVEDSDPVGERVRTLKEWVQSGKISWPEIAAIFSNARHVAMLLPRKNAKVRVIGKKVGKDFEYISIDMVESDKERILEIRIKAKEE